MLDSNISRLEEKVVKAVRLIQELKTENARLREQQEALEQEMSSLQEQRAQLGQELTAARQATATVERYEESRRILEEKVGGLLEKLDQIG